MFKEGGFREYKPKVLRRKLQNGTTLNGTTESIDLDCGSIVHGVKLTKSRWEWEKNEMSRGEGQYKDYNE